MPQTSPGLILTGRVLLAIYFLLPGIMKFAAWDLHIRLMETHNVPFAGPLLAVSGTAAVLGGLALLTGRHVRLAALGFVGYILLVNLNLHDFWNAYEGVSSERELQNFVKNLGILAGCLVLAGASKGRALRLDDILKSDKNV